MCVYRSGRPPQKLRSESNHFRVPANAVCVISLCVCVCEWDRTGEKKGNEPTCLLIYIHIEKELPNLFSPKYDCEKQNKKPFSHLLFFLSPLSSWGLSLPSPTVQGKYIERMALRERSRSSTDNTKKSDDNTKRTHVPALRLIFFLTLFYHPLYSFIWFSFVWFLSQPKGER